MLKILDFMTKVFPSKIAEIITIHYNTCLYLIMCIGVLVPSLYLTFTFAPGSDYAIYTYFAEAVSNGVNPYNIPSTYRSEIVPTFFPVGGTQPIAGVISPRYADYPPLLMLVNRVLFQFHPVKGLYYLYIILFILCFPLYLIYKYRENEKNISQSFIPLLFLLFLGFNPIFIAFWFRPIEDKVIFAIFILFLLLTRNNKYVFTVCCGIFAALKGLGIPIFFFYILSYLSYRKSVKTLLFLLLIFCTIIFISHSFFYPEWINGYKWRSDRQNIVGHNSLFLIPNKLGLYFNGLGMILTLLSFIILTAGVYKQYIRGEGIIIFPIVFSIIFNTESGFNRLLVLLFGMLAITNNPKLLLFSYLMGIIVTRTDHYTYLDKAYLQTISWGLAWFWILIVTFICIKEHLSRKKSDLISDITFSV